MSDNPQVYPFKRKAHEFDGENNRTKYNLAEQLGQALPKKREKFSLENLLLLPFTLVDFCMLLAGFCLGHAQVLGGLFPFGLAFIAAACNNYRHNAGLVTLSVVLGYAFALKNASVAYILAGIVIAGIIYFAKQDEKKVWIVTPGVVLAVGIMLRSFFLVFAGDISSYTLMALFFEGIIAAGLSIVFMIVLDVISDYKSINSLATDELVCIFVLLLGCISGLGSFAIGGVAIRDVASRFLVMLAAVWGGAGAGAGVGAMLGIVPSLSMMAAPSTVGLYAFAGLLAGAFSNFGRIGASAGFMLANIMLSLYIIDGTQISMHILSSMVAVALLFLIPPKFVKAGNKIFNSVNLRSYGEERSNRMVRLAARRLKTTSWIFRELSDTCRMSLTNDLKQGEVDNNNIEMVLQHLCNRVCTKCSIYQLCWTLDFDETYRGVMTLFNVSDRNGVADVKDAPENFQKRCPHIRELVASVNCLYELYCQNNYWQNQKYSSQLFLAGQLEGTADVLENLAKDINGGDRDSGHIEKLLAKGMAKSGLPVDGVQLTHYGDKTIDLWLNFNGCPGENLCREVLEKQLAKITQKHFRVQEASCSNGYGAGCRFHMLKEGAKNIKIGKAQLAKSGKGVCGDCGSNVTLSEGKQLLMISDGMGAGFDAAMNSNNAINMLSKLLEVGFNRDTAIDTVNTVMMLQGGEESFVTLDMCIIDLYENSAEFVKTGASPSFIKRGNNVKVIKSSSLPVGMLQTVEKAVVKESLLNGDMVILASDGLLDADSKIDMDWLIGLLADTNITDAQGMAEFLLGKAIAISGGRLRDDITVLVATVDAA